MQHHQHIHHLHDLNHIHYDVSTHDNYPAHVHIWAGNNHFDTCLDPTAIGADDHQLDTPGSDHDHPGYDIRWADNHSRTSRSSHNPATTAG